MGRNDEAWRPPVPGEDRPDPYRTLVESLPHTVWMTDARGDVHYLNPRGAQEVGLPAAEVSKGGWLELLHPEDLPRAREAWAEAVRTGTVYRCEYRVRREDGGYRWYLSQAVPQRDAAGEVASWVGTWTDVDELKRAQEALARDALLLAGVRDSVIVTDLDGVVTYWNEGATRLFGWTAEEMVGRPMIERYPAELRPEIEAIMAGLATGGEWSGEWEDVRKDGSRVWIDARTVRIRDAAGRPVGLMGLSHEITERKQAETELRRLEEQYRQAQKLEAVGQLAGGVAHDFNNLLTVINGYSDLLLSTLDAGDPNRSMVEEIRRAGERSASLTRQLLAFSRRQVLVPQALDLNTVVRDTERMLRRMIGEDVELATDLAADLHAVRVDPGQLQQVLLNLAVNARDAMPRGGRLTLRTRNVTVAEDGGEAGLGAGDWVLLQVEDTGAGMSEEVERRVFEPFFTTKEAGKGTGLGLAVVLGIVEQSGGRVGVRSRPGEGTRFDIHLPRVRRPTADAAAGATAPVPRGTETILLVEDDAAVRSLTRHVLERADYAVLEAASGDEALALAAEYPSPIHLLVTDVVLPGMGGRQVAEGLRALRPEIKVLYVSGYTDDAVVRHGVLQEDVQFLQKPFPPMALAKKVREVLAM